MKVAINESVSLSSSDQAELRKLVSILELASETTIIFAITQESGPQHPVVQELRFLLEVSDVDFQLHDFFYGERLLYDFLDRIDQTNQQTPQAGRQLVMIFGIEQLPTLSLVRQMKQLNLSREMLLGGELVLIFWLSQAEFLSEFRNRAPAFWNQRHEVLSFQARPTLTPLLYPYLEWLIAENSYLKIPSSPSVKVFLEQIYVPLQAEQWQHPEVERGQHQVETLTWSPDKQKGRVLHFSRHNQLAHDFGMSATRTKIDLLQVVRENQHIVILGTPGAGKTTLLRYLTLQFAIAQRDGQETVFCGCGQEELGNPLLPVFLRIPEYAEKLNQQSDLSFWNYLRQFYCPWAEHFQHEAGTEVAALLLEKIRQGRCLILLDGLDEVFDQDNRKLVVERINQFVAAYPNKFAIASRIGGYQNVKLSDCFREFVIADMGSAQVKKFLHRWCRAIKEAQQPAVCLEQWQRVGNAQARKIFATIQANQGVKRLTANPLLLTMLVLVDQHGLHLPTHRVKLYELATQGLIEELEVHSIINNQQFALSSVKLLSLLAYWMHEQKSSALITKAEAEQLLLQKLHQLSDTHLESDLVQQIVRQFLQQVNETTGLFMEPVSGVYSFMHLTFEEYFAARFITDNSQSEILRLIDSHLDKPHWDEPILLALSHYSIEHPNQVSQLIEQLFSKIDTYKPAISGNKITIKNISSTDVILVWSATNCNQFELPLKNLLFAGRVLTEVKVNSRVREKLIQKIVVTYLGLNADLKNESIQQLLKLLRQIEVFNQQGEVISQLKQVASESTLSELIHIKAQLAILYVACGQPGIALVDCVTNLIDHLNSLLFISFKELVAQLGKEITPALESIRRNYQPGQASLPVLNLAIAFSYIRTAHYEKAIALLEGLVEEQAHHASPFIPWALAICYQEKYEYSKASIYYRQAFERFKLFPEKTALLTFWRNWSICCQLHAEYEQSIEYFPQKLTVTQAANQSEDWGEYERGVEFQQQCSTPHHSSENQLVVALNHYQLGCTHQAQGKYEQAAKHYQQSGNLYQQLDRNKSAAEAYYQLGRTYQASDKYEQAVECQWQCLKLRQKLEEQGVVALSYYQLGHIYQSWGKYEQAIQSYHNSCCLYQQLGQDKNVADVYYQIGRIYQAWGNYQQAVDYQQQCLMLHQKSENQVLIALAYCQLGQIYQTWGDYEQAIHSYQNSSELYQQLGRDKDMADQWHRLASCYQAWGKPEQAIPYYQRSRQVYQQLAIGKEVAYTDYQLGCIYQAWGKYEQAIKYYQYSRELYQQLGLDEELAIQLFWLATCYQMQSQHEQAVECQQQFLILHRHLGNEVLVALGHYQLGRIYQSWGKYKQATEYYHHSCNLYQQLGLEKNAADAYYHLGCIYQAWHKYQEAVECQQQCLKLRKKLEDRPAEASSYYQLGRIYQAWGNYKQAIEYYQHSHNLYQQLSLDKDVANLWDWMANCYQAWGQYQQAIACQQQCLILRQRLEDQSLVALSYYQLGRIYQSWNKYEQAIQCYQHSCDLYQHLGRERDVVNLWKWLARCYRDWWQDQQVVECPKTP